MTDINLLFDEYLTYAEYSIEYYMGDNNITNIINIDFLDFVDTASVWEHNQLVFEDRHIHYGTAVIDEVIFAWVIMPLKPIVVREIDDPILNEHWKKLYTYLKKYE